MFDQAQLRKGTLEGCILKIIDREPTYGYAIATTRSLTGNRPTAMPLPPPCGTAALPT